MQTHYVTSHYKNITAIYLKKTFSLCVLFSHAYVSANAFLCELGEMQGTVHRRLLEDRQGELTTGAVLLLKQVTYRCLICTTLPIEWKLELCLKPVRRSCLGGRVLSF